MALLRSKFGGRTKRKESSFSELKMGAEIPKITTVLQSPLFISSKFTRSGAMCLSRCKPSTNENRLGSSHSGLWMSLDSCCGCFEETNGPSNSPFSSSQFVHAGYQGAYNGGASAGDKR